MAATTLPVLHACRKIAELVEADQAIARDHDFQVDPQGLDRKLIKRT